MRPPLAFTATGTMRPKSTTARVSPPRSPRLCVVHHFRTRELWMEYLTFHGFETVGVPNGALALDEAHARHPDVIVMDLMLPHVDGWEAARRLKNHPRTAHIPIVACTADVVADSAERALLAGCDSYVVKPCAPEDLLREICKTLPRLAANRRRA